MFPGVEDGVGEATRAAGDGNRPVTHGDHLAEAARFEARWHEEEIGAGIDTPGETLIEDRGEAHVGRVALFGCAQGAFVLRVAVAENDHVHAHCDDPGDGFDEDVDALLAREASDKPCHRSRARGHLQLLAEGKAIGVASIEGVGVEAAGDMDVRRGIEDLGVEAVEDAAEHVTAQAEHVLETFAVFPAQDFAGVPRADGGDGVAVIDAAAEDIVELIRAAVLEVVHGQHRRRLFEAGDVPGGHAQGEGNGGRVPVVEMDDMWLPLRVAHDFGDRAAEELVTQEVVWLAVDVRAGEGFAVADDEHGGLARTCDCGDLCGDCRAERPGNVDPVAGRGCEGRLGRAMAGDDDAHIVAEACQRAGQPEGDIGEAADLRVGVSFGSAEEDSHVSGSIKRSRSISSRESLAAAMRQRTTSF